MACRVVPRGKLRSCWEVASFVGFAQGVSLTLATGPGHWQNGEAGSGDVGEWKGRTDGCGMQPPRGSICPQGPSGIHLFLAIDFWLRAALPHAIAVSARTTSPPPLRAQQPAPSTHPWPL